MTQKMTPQEFAAKTESEGFDYAFTEYGLSHRDLDRADDPGFYDAVKEYVEALREIQPLRSAVEEYLEEYMEF